MSGYRQPSPTRARRPARRCSRCGRSDSHTHKVMLPDGRNQFQPFISREDLLMIDEALAEQAAVR